jgi:hypothetical protein
MSERVLYENRRVNWASMVVGVIIDVALASTAPRYGPASEIETAVGFVIIAIIIAVLCMMTVRVTDTMLEWNMSLKAIGVRVPIAEIESARPIKTPLTWGIYPTRDGWLWNVSGNDAIALTLHNGKKYVVGVADHEPVMRAIAKAGKALKA